MIVDQRYLTRGEAAEYLTDLGYKIAPASLAKRAVVGGGPPFRSWGRKPLYDPEALLEWAQARCTGPRRSTSDHGGPRPATGEDLPEVPLETSPRPPGRGLICGPAPVQIL